MDNRDFFIFIFIHHFRSWTFLLLELDKKILDLNFMEPKCLLDVNIETDTYK